MVTPESFQTTLQRASVLQRDIHITQRNIFQLSETSKLDGIPSWSTQAWVSCPGKDNSPVCTTCYAMEGRYLFPSTLKSRMTNMEAIKHPEFVSQAVKTVRIYSYLRLFDSGDFPTPDAIRKWTAIASQCPDTKFWVPTRVHKLPQYEAELQKLEALPNVVVRRSSDSLTGEFTPGIHGSTVVHDYATRVPGVTVCQALAPQNNRTCNGCRACWDKSIPVIGYPAHGMRYKWKIKRGEV